MEEILNKYNLKEMNSWDIGHKEVTKTNIKINQYNHFPTDLDAILNIITNNNSQENIIGVDISEINVFSNSHITIYSKEKLNLDNLNNYIDDHLLNGFDDFKVMIDNILNTKDTNPNHIPLYIIKHYIDEINKKKELRTKEAINAMNRLLGQKYPNKFFILNISIENDKIIIKGKNQDDYEKLIKEIEIFFKIDNLGLYYSSHRINGGAIKDYSIEKDIPHIIGIIGTLLNEFYQNNKDYIKLTKEADKVYECRCLNNKLYTRIGFNGLEESGIKLHTYFKDYSKEFDLIKLNYYHQSNTEYEYTSNYCNIVNLMLDNEQKIFLNTYIDINELPEWMHENIKSIRIDQLSNQGIELAKEKEHIKCI